MTASPACRQELSEVSEKWLLDEDLSPRRSSSVAGRARLVGAVAGVDLAASIFLYWRGLGPIVIFFTLSAAALWLALVVNAHRVRSGERLSVSRSEVRLSRGSGAKHGVIWTSPTYFTRVIYENQGPGQVWLALSARRIEIAKGLGGPERRALAARLERALLAARKSAE